jgi:hypothetical protein
MSTRRLIVHYVKLKLRHFSCFVGAGVIIFVAAYFYQDKLLELLKKNSKNRNSKKQSKADPKN